MHFLSSRGRNVCCQHVSQSAPPVRWNEQGSQALTSRYQRFLYSKAPPASHRRPMWPKMPQLEHVGALWGLVGWSWGLFGLSWRPPSQAVFGLSWGSPGALFWAALEVLEVPRGPLRPFWGTLGLRS